MANKIDYRLDENGLAHLWQRIKLLVTNNVSNKVDKVDGKGLSTNDYTNAEKTKLAGIAEGAQKNVQPDWNASTGDGAILNKPTVPTKVSQLTNDRQYQTDDDVTASISTRLGKLDFNSKTDFEKHITDGDIAGRYLVIDKLNQTDGKISASGAVAGDVIKSKIDALVDQNYLATQRFVTDNVASAVGKITSFEYKVVSELPPESDGEKGTIYLLRRAGKDYTNLFDEYILVDTFTGTDGIVYSAHYEKIGTTDIDLTQYAKKTDIPTKVSQLTNDSDFETKANVGSRITGAINSLDYSDTAEEGKYVSSVSETDGVIRVARANFADAIPAITETQIDNICTF